MLDSEFIKSNGIDPYFPVFCKQLYSYFIKKGGNKSYLARFFRKNGSSPSFFAKLKEIHSTLPFLKIRKYEAIF